MKKWIAPLVLGLGLVACQANDSTQNVRDNENRVATPDVTNNQETEPDTTAVVDSSSIRQ